MAGYSEMYKDECAAQERRARIDACPEFIPDLTEGNLREAIGRYVQAERELASLKAGVRNVVNSAFGGTVRTL